MPTTTRQTVRCSSVRLISHLGLFAGVLVLGPSPVRADVEMPDTGEGADGDIQVAAPVEHPIDGGVGAGYTVEHGELVAGGETITDIDDILAALDRRAPVSAVAFSPDGNLIASGAEDHVVRLWQPGTGQLLRRLEGHDAAVTAIAFSPDGSTLASASNDRTVRLWDVHTGRLLHTLQGHVYHVYALAFDGQGRRLATGSWDRTVQLWDTSSGTLLKKLRGHGGPVRALDFSRDGKLLVSGADDQTVRLWNADTGAALGVLARHAGPVNAVRFRPDGTWVFSGSSDHTVRVARLPDGAIAHKLADCGAPVLSLAVSGNGQILAGACGGGGSVLWDVGTGTELHRGGGAGVETRAIAFSSDGRRVASGDADATILVEDVATGRTLTSLSANLAHLAAVAFSPDGKQVAAGASDGRVMIWQGAGDHQRLGQVLPSGQGALRALAFSPDGKCLASVGEDRHVVLWDLAGDGPKQRLRGRDGGLDALVFLPDQPVLASGGEDGAVRLWDLERDTAKVLKGHRGPVRALAVSADGKMLASGSDDETVRVWESASGRSLAVLGGSRSPLTAVGFTADGKYLITGSRDHGIDVWLLAKRKLLKNLHKDLTAGPVALVALGQHLVVASSDGVLGLWDVAGTRPLEQSAAPADAPSAIAIAPDGAIASVGRDGVLRTWDADTLAPRWSLAGGARDRWVACDQAHHCWRDEDGTLLGRVTSLGDRVAVSPSDEAHRTSLAAQVDRRSSGDAIEVAEGRTVAIPIRIENRGTQPAYWVRIAQAAAGRGALLLIPPPPLALLAPGDSASVVCEVSALADYENPRPHPEILRLAVSSASADEATLDVPMAVETPHLQLHGLALLRGPSEAVVASMVEVSMAELEPVRVQGSLTLERADRTSIAPVMLEQPFIGQDLALAFPLPEGVELDRNSRATFTLRKSTHPVHVWTFAHAPVHIPLPVWFWAVLVGGALGLGFVVWRARLYAQVRPLGRMGKRWARLSMAVLRVLLKGVVALICIRSTVRVLGMQLQRRSIAITFFRLEPETQCSHLARQLGASWSPLAGAHQPVFELHLGPEVPLNVARVLLALPTGEGTAAALAELDAVDEGPSGISVVLSELPRVELAARLSGPRRLVVLDKAAMSRVLRAPRPALAFAQVVSEQVDRLAISLYRSAVSRGQRQPFHGRKSELRRLTSDLGKNYLIVGPQGIGKTSLLDELHRRLRGQAAVECLYLSLADGDLTGALGDALGMPGEPLLDILLERLVDRPEGKQVVVLCDDADAWATLDAARGGAQLQTLALLNQEHPCAFVLAGFLGLLHAARPARGRKRFGEVVRLESLDAESCAELATLPMAALNVRYAKTALVEQVARQSAGMPSLVAVICDQMLERLLPDQHIIDRSEVEGACKSEATARAITAWRPRFGLPEPRFATLDQAVMLSAVFKPRFTLDELRATLAGLGVHASAGDIEQAADRLVAACVFERWLGQFSFRVPIFQAVMQEATLARMIGRLTPEPSATT